MQEHKHTTTSPGTRVVQFARDGKRSGMLMLACAILGLVLANLPAASAGYETVAEYVFRIPLAKLDMTIADWARDGLLAVFFLVVGLDLRCEVSTGSLSHFANAAVPVLAAIGGVAAPALIYLAINAFSPATMQGWTVPTATDIAFSTAVLALAGGTRALHLRTFLTTLAVADDVIGIVLIAVVYSHGGNIWAFAALAICLIAWGVLTRCRRVPWLLAIPIAIGAWYAALLAGIHPTIATVTLGLLAPGRPVHGEQRARAERWSNAIGPFSSLITLPIFAFFAMGVSLSGIGMAVIAGPVFLGVLLGLVIGKPLGVSLVVSLCRVFHLIEDRPSQGAGRLNEIGIAQLCGIGFTVAFLMADLAFDDPASAGIAKFAVLVGSLASALIGAAELGLATHRQHRNHLDLEQVSSYD